MKELNSIAGDSIVHTFNVKLLTVNGEHDADSTNNIMSSSFYSAPLWPSTFKIIFRPNVETISAASNVSETSWAIYDMNNNVVRSRTNALANVSGPANIYTDTIALATGYYKFVIYDSSCDGLQWWANPGEGAGYINVRRMAGTLIPMNGYNYTGTYNNDFGCGFTQYFYMIGTPNGLTNISDAGLNIEAYPNPAQNVVNVDLTGVQDIKGTLQVVDALGRTVAGMPCTSSHQQVNLSSFANGVYTIVFLNELTGNKLTTRLLIAK